MAFEIAPLRALVFDLDRASQEAAGLVAPPYDIISPDEHRRLLDRSPWNIVRLTLGERPGEKEDYRARGERLLEWKRRGVLREDPAPGLFIYGCDYPVPGSDRRATFRGLIALGKLHPFEDRLVLPHERTFPDVVDDRYRLLETTRTHLELIFLLHEDPERRLDRMLAGLAAGEPLLAAPGKPGETHALWAVRDHAAIAELRGLFRLQRPVIADGHHRYTTALLYHQRRGGADGGDRSGAAGSGWQPMVFGNLLGDGLSILATHRLADAGGRLAQALEVLDSRLQPAGESDWDLAVETRERRRTFRIPAAVREGRRGVAATDYAILHELILGEWLRPLLTSAPGGEAPVKYFKEGSGEREALERGGGNLLFRMRPVSPRQFREVVDGGEVFPHKTTFFYPKIWSGFLLWSLAEPEL